MTSKPRAYRLADPAGPAAPAIEVALERPVTIVDEPSEIVEAADGVSVPAAAPRWGLPSWGGLLASTAGALAMLAVGLGVERLVAALFEAAPWLGWVALALVALAALALVGLVAREIAGVWRERRVERIRERAGAAIRARSDGEARAVVAELSTFYAGRPELAGARGRLDKLGDEILDAEDRIGLYEHELLGPLDALARARIAEAARGVSAVTALSPRAIVDVAFVVFAAARLLRRIASIYGGRPGFLGALGLARAALSHLAVTGGVAVGDSLLQQVLGLGLAARVSAKLGEGVLNGLMTARFGLAVVAVCRPLPFVREAPPRVGDVAGELLRGLRDEDAR